MAKTDEKKDDPAVEKGDKGRGREEKEKGQQKNPTPKAGTGGNPDGSN